MNEIARNYSRIFVVGVCRNVENTVQNEIYNLKKVIGKSLNSFFIVESDSEDSTVELLEQLQNKVENFSYLSLGNLREKMPSRTNRIAYCRNQYMDYLDKSANDDDLIVVADLDGANQDLTQSRFESIWQRTDWAACTANQKFAYFDIWALRASGWSEGDWMVEFDALTDSGMSHKRALSKALYSKMITIKEDSEWIPVDSAFGGLGIYKFSSIRGLRYFGEIKNVKVCEHVPFHSKIRDKGGTIFIVPGLINCNISNHTRILLKSVAFKTKVIQHLRILLNKK